MIPLDTKVKTPDGIGTIVDHETVPIQVPVGRYESKTERAKTGRYGIKLDENVREIPVSYYWLNELEILEKSSEST